MLPAQAHILELGAGEGRNSLYLARQGFHVTAIDAAPTAIARLKAIAQKEGLTVTAIALPVEEYPFRQTFDLIIATGLLHFLPPQIGNSIIAKMKAATRVKGLNLIATLASDHPRRQMPHIYKNQELKKLYQDWHILVYQEVRGHLHGLAQVNLHLQPPKVAKLLAQKPE